MHKSLIMCVLADKVFFAVFAKICAFQKIVVPLQPISPFWKNMSEKNIHIDPQNVPESPVSLLMRGMAGVIQEKDAEMYQLRQEREYYKEQLSLVSHRDYTTGFYLGKPGREDQIYTSASYIKQIDFAGKVLRTEEDSLLVEQRGKFLKGDELFLLTQKGRMCPVNIEYIRAEDGTEQGSAPHAQQRVRIPRPKAEKVIPEGTILVRKTEG